MIFDKNPHLKPELLVQIPDDSNATLAAHHINMQRVTQAAGFPHEIEQRAIARKAGAKLLSDVVEKVVTRLAPDTVLEIGAHEASFSRRMALLLPESRVVAFEANPEVYERYRDQVQHSGVEFIHACVSNSEEAVRFNVPIKNDKTKKTMGSILMDSQADGHQTYDVDTVMVDRFLSDSPGTNAMWIDVEGAVATVLDCSRETLKNCVALFVELETAERWPGQSLAHDILPKVCSAGLVPILVDNQREWQFNVLFIRPDALRNADIVTYCVDYAERSGRR